MPGRMLSPAVLFLVALSASLAGCHDSTPATPTCTCTIASPTVTFTAAGGAGTVTVATGASCPWTAAADASWVSLVSGTSGSGPATIQFTVTANNDTTLRRALLTVGGQIISLAQDGRAACQYAIAPSSFDLAAAGGTGSIAVTSGAGCSWASASSDGWLSILSGSSGAGSGTVTFSVAAQSATTSRQASMTVAGQAVVVRQAGATPPPPPPPPNCEYSVSPLELIEHWHATGFSLTITTSAGCTWTAAPDQTWINLDRTAGEGSASIAVSHGQFIEDATRRAAVQVRWPTQTAGQNVWVTQEGCRYGAEPAASIPASGGTHRVTVVTQPLSASCSIGCPWTATSSVPWIRITSSMPMAGDDAFSYEVDANAGSARVGTIAVAGRTHVVSQAGV